MDAFYKDPKESIKKTFEKTFLHWVETDGCFIWSQEVHKIHYLKVNVQHDTIRPGDRGTNNKFAVCIKKYIVTKNCKVAVQDKDL